MCLRLGPRCCLPPSPTAVGVSPKWRTTDNKGTVTLTLGMASRRRRRKRQRRTSSGESSKSKPNPRASRPLMTSAGGHEPLLACVLPSSLPQSRQGQERGYFNGRATASSGKWCVALPHVSMFTVAGHPLQLVCRGLPVRHRPSPPTQARGHPSTPRRCAS